MWKQPMYMWSVQKGTPNWGQGKQEKDNNNSNPKLKIKTQCTKIMNQTREYNI